MANFYNYNLICISLVYGIRFSKYYLNLYGLLIYFIIICDSSVNSTDIMNIKMNSYYVK